MSKTEFGDWPPDLSPWFDPFSPDTPRTFLQAGVSSFSSVQFSSLAQSCPTLCDPKNRSTPGLPIHHQFPEFTQAHVHRVSDAIQPSHPLSSPSPFAPNPSQHQSLFQWVNSSHEVAKLSSLEPLSPDENEVPSAQDFPLLFQKWPQGGSISLCCTIRCLLWLTFIF